MDLNIKELSCFYQITKKIIKENNLDNVLHETLKILSQELGYNRGIISIYHKNLDEIHLDTFSFDQPTESIKYRPGEGITGEVIQTGNPIVIPRLDKNSDFKDKTMIRRDLDKSKLAFFCIPIKYSNETIGALSVDTENSDDKKDFSHELSFLSSISDLIAEVVKKKLLDAENKRLKQILLNSNPLGTLIGNSKKMKELSYQISIIADKNVIILIMGETGTGKELVAREIHNTSKRKDNPFIAVNCGAMPEGLIESELFGHKKGSFSGAINDRIGKFEAANNGTLFLDEIGELPLALQVKLLRAIQEKEITRVGENVARSINTRIIAATNKNLEEEVKNGNFRADLFYRLNVFPLFLPPLRERGADIILLADFFIKKYSKLLGKNILRLDTPSIDMLMAYHWPGNVRELENCIERACLLAEGDTIYSHYLPPSLQIETLSDRNKKSPSGKFSSLVKAYEIELIIQSLKDNNGNQTKAAIALGTTKRILQYKIASYNIDYKRFIKKEK